MKEIKIVIDSICLGDTLSWIPYVDKLQKETNHKVYLACNYSDLFEKEYKNIHFVKADETYLINQIKHNPDYMLATSTLPYNWQTMPQQKIASDILDIKYKEIKPKVTVPDKPRNIMGKYVTIACHSTAQLKYWNNFDGWQEVVDFLRSEGYNVVCIDKHRVFGAEDISMVNGIPNRVIDKTSSNLTLFDRMIDLKYADFHIGLASGLSWLSWAVGTHVHVISGFSTTDELFKSGITKSLPTSKDICQGCWNSKDFNWIKNRHDWGVCPEHKDTPRQFECSKSITGEQVINDIKKLIKKN